MSKEGMTHAKGKPHKKIDLNDDILEKLDNFTRHKGKEKVLKVLNATKNS